MEKEKIDPEAFKKAVSYFRQFGDDEGIEHTCPEQKFALEVLLFINKKLFLLAKLVKEQEGGLPIIKTMQYSDLEFTQEKSNRNRCCFCHGKGELVKIVLKANKHRKDLIGLLMKSTNTSSIINLRIKSVVLNCIT